MVKLNNILSAMMHDIKTCIAMVIAWITSGTGISQIFGWLPQFVGLTASIIGIFFTIKLGRIQYKKIKLEIEYRELKLKECNGELDKKSLTS